jgi:hypothetical protein
MDLRSQLDKYRQEHEEVLRFLKVWEGALTLAGSGQDGERSKGLAELRGMEKRLERIRQHCDEEGEDAESPFVLYLPDAELKQIREEHEQLAHSSSDFQRELTYATTSRTTEMVQSGRQLLAMLRQHLVHEEELLKRIQEAQGSEDALRLQKG